MRTADEVRRKPGENEAGDHLGRDGRRTRIYSCVKGESSASRASGFVMPVMQIDAVPLGVRYDTGFVARERERRARNSQLTDNGQDHCQQAEAPH